MWGFIICGGTNGINGVYESPDRPGKTTGSSPPPDITTEPSQADGESDLRAALTAVETSLHGLPPLPSAHSITAIKKTFLASAGAFHQRKKTASGLKAKFRKWRMGQHDALNERSYETLETLSRREKTAMTYELSGRELSTGVPGLTDTVYDPGKGKALVNAVLAAKKTVAKQREATETRLGHLTPQKTAGHKKNG